MVLSLGVHVCIAYKFAIKRKQYPQNSFCNNRGQLIKYRVQPRDPKVPYATLLFGFSQRLRLQLTPMTPYGTFLGTDPWTRVIRQRRCTSQGIRGFTREVWRKNSLLRMGQVSQQKFTLSRE